MSGPARARIIERLEDVITSGVYGAIQGERTKAALQAAKQSGEREVYPIDIGSHPQRIFAVEGLVDVAPLIRALNENEVVHVPGSGAVLFVATPQELAGLRAALLQRANPVADAVVEAVDAAVAAHARPARDVVWPGGRLELSRRAHIMGVVNVTPDSFSDGGRFFDAGAAIEHGLRLAEHGADILDVGGESTRPGADPVEPDEEAKRVVPVIQGLVARIPIPVSIDTTKAEVARAALDAGARIVNDVSAGRFDDAMFALAAEREVPIVLMHMLGEPRTMQQNPSYGDVVGDIAAFLSERAGHARAAGVDRRRIIVDPGFGFGKTREHNLVLLRRLREFACLGYPVLAGTSRKSFIGTTLDVPVEDRLEGTAATVALAVANGASIVRVHDVGPMHRVAGMVEAVMRATQAGSRGEA